MSVNVQKNHSSEIFFISQSVKFSSIYLGKTNAEVIFCFQSLSWQLLGIIFSENNGIFSCSDLWYLLWHHCQVKVKHSQKFR